MQTHYSIYLLGLAVTVCLAGCAQPKDGSSAAQGSAATTTVSTDTAIKQISANWNQAENWVPRVKAKYQQGPEFNKARDLYDKAKSENNAWLELLVTNIKDGKKPEKSSEFTNQAKVAAEASQEFVDYAKSLQGSSPKPGVAIAGVTAVVDLLINSGFKVWTEYGKHQQTQRTQKADDLRTRLKWPTWEKAGT